MADAFSRGEAHYATAMPNDPTPEQTDEDKYWAGLAEIIHQATPELAAIAFQGKGALHGPARAHFLLALWEKVHDRLHALPEQTNTVQLVPLPTAAAETPEAWRKRIERERTPSLNPSPNPDPSQP